MEIYTNEDLEFDFESTAPPVAFIRTHEDCLAKAFFGGEVVNGVHSIEVFDEEGRALKKLFEILQDKFAKLPMATHWDGCWRVHRECAVRRVEELEERLSVTKAVRDNWRSLFMRWKERSDDYLEEWERCQEELAECREQCDMWRQEHDLQAEWHTKLEEEIAAAQARERELREVISDMISNTTAPHNEYCDCDVCEAKFNFNACDALAPVPLDHSALEAALEQARAEERERCQAERKELEEELERYKGWIGRLL